MPTVVDALVVELELDPKKFDSGRRQAEDSFEKTKLAALKTGKEIEGQAKKTGDAFGLLNKNVLGLFAAFTGVGATAFLTQMIHADSSTGRTAKTIGMATKELSTWEGAAEMAGAKTGEVTSGFVSLTQALKTAELAGDASLGGHFRQLFNIDVAGPNGLKSASELYLEIADKAAGMDPAKASTAMALLGIPSGVIPLLLQGRDAVQKTLDDVSKLGPATDADAAAARRFETAWTRAWLNIKAAARGAYPLGESVGNKLSFEFGKESRDALHAFFFESPEEFSKKFAIYNAAARAQRHGDTAAPTKDTLAQVGTGTASSSLPAGGAFTSQAEKEAFIRAEAIKRGIDPNTAVAVAKSEGFYGYKSSIPGETSYGAYQLHYGGDRWGPGKGLGDTFTKRTGLDARDPATEKEQIKFALDQAKQGGWGPWHGWKGAAFAGINGGALAATTGAASRSSTATTEVHIGKIEVVTQARDADGVASALSDAIRRDLHAQQANDGPQ